ncbi:DUF559 domain-containing protein [Novosphingobium colocasiae]
MLWRYLARGQMGGRSSAGRCRLARISRTFSVASWALLSNWTGFSHNARPEYDLARDRWMAEQGLRVLRFPNAAVLREMEMVLAAVSAEISVLRGGSGWPTPLRLAGKPASLAPLPQAGGGASATAQRSAVFPLPLAGGARDLGRRP